MITMKGEKHLYRWYYGEMPDHWTTAVSPMDLFLLGVQNPALEFPPWLESIHSIPRDVRDHQPRVSPLQDLRPSYERTCRRRPPPPVRLAVRKTDIRRK